MNIIGICGQKNSGKSTIAKMIAELVPGTVEVQLAEPLKRFCADVFGWGEEILNGPSEMREKPDERYVRGYRVPSGEYAAGLVLKDVQFLALNDGEKPETVYLTPRYALQRLGTEFGRVCYEDVWIDYALRTAKRHLEVGYEVSNYAKMCQHERRVAPFVVISDVRFVNEARKIREAGGQVWRVMRPSRMDVPNGPVCGCGRPSELECGLCSACAHASEHEQFSAEMDQFVNWTIANDRTLDDLRADVKSHLAK